MRGSSICTFAVMFVSLFISSVNGQKRERGPGEFRVRQPGEILHRFPRPMAHPSLHVQEYSGEFTQFVTAKTIDAPAQTRFVFRNDYSDVVSAKWQLSREPMPGNDPTASFPGFVATGPVQVPPKGSSKFFEIDLPKHIPVNVPQPAKCYVRVIVERGQSAAPSVGSNVVVVTIQKSTAPAVRFTAQGLGLTTKQKHPHLYKNPTLPVELNLTELYVGNDNEGADEPYLFIAVLYVDGTTINPLSLSTSTVRISSPTKTHGNVPDETKNGDDLDQGRTAIIPSSTGRFSATIAPIGLDLAADMEDADGKIGASIADGTAVYVLCIAMEEDATDTDAANAARAAMVQELSKRANGVVQSLSLGDLIQGNTPKFDPAAIEKELRSQMMAAGEDETKGTGWWTPAMFPLLLDDVVDPDDYVGWALKKFTYGELLAAGSGGIKFELSLSNSDDWEGAYTVKGTIKRK
jgi:hypothetical protein